MANINTYTAHVTCATLMNADQLVASVVAAITGNEASTEINEGTVNDPAAFENAALKIQANLSHIVD